MCNVRSPWMKGYLHVFTRNGPPVSSLQGDADLAEVHNWHVHPTFDSEEFGFSIGDQFLYARINWARSLLNITFQSNELEMEDDLEFKARLVKQTNKYMQVISSSKINKEVLVLIINFLNNFSSFFSKRSFIVNLNTSRDQS